MDIKTFVSFSNIDKLFVSKLISRLLAQRLTVWDYSNEGEEIPGSVDIARFLREKVAQNDLFLPIVSKASLKSDYTRTEVATALSRQKQFGSPIIIPLVSIEQVDQVWPSPYKELQKIRYFEVNFDDRMHWEKAIHRICDALSIQYFPLFSEDKRLPFIGRFDEELKIKKPREPERFNSLIRRLGEIRDRFCIAFDGGDYQKANQAIAYFNAQCAYEFPDQPFYYPMAAEAVSLIALGRFHEALEIAQYLLNTPGINADETAYGIMGYIKQTQGAHQESAYYYHEALRLDPNDPAAASGVVVNEILCGNTCNLTDVISVLEKGIFYTKKDIQQAMAIKAFALIHKGRINEARQLFAELWDQGNRDEQVLINFARTLMTKSLHEQALKTLEAGLALDPANKELLNWKMNMQLEIKDNPGAVATAQTAVNYYSNDISQRYNLLTCLFINRESNRCSSEAQRLLKDFIPQTPENFYQTGFANWILGQEDRAEYDFERSCYPSSEHYRNFI